MYMDAKMAETAPVQKVFKACNDLDLFRCYGKDKMETKLQQLEKGVGKHAAASIADVAEAVIAATGDRRIFLRLSSGTRDYQIQAFKVCSTNAAKSIEAIRSATANSATKAPAAFRGEASVRFSGSRFKLLHTTANAG